MCAFAHSARPGRARTAASWRGRIGRGHRLQGLRPAVLGLLLACVFPSRSVLAQAACNGGTNCSLTVTLRLGRPQVFRLALSTASTTVPPVAAPDFAAGFRDVTGPLLTVSANAPYRVTIQAAVPTWQYAGSAANPSKPASHLQWSRVAGGPFTSTATAATLWPASGTSAPATAGQTIPLFYRTIWQWTGNPPGTYTLPVNITLTSP